MRNESKALDCAVGAGINPHYAGNLDGESDELKSLRLGLAAQVESLRAQLAAQVPTIHSVMDLAKAIHATKTGADEWEALRQWEVDVFRQSAEAIMKQLWPDMLSAAPSQQAPQPEQTATPDGKVLVPLRMNAEMERVVQEEGWQWADVLEAAEATTLEQDAIARGHEPEQAPVGWVAPRPDVVDWSSYEPEIGTPLYTTPQQASEPMTDKQIESAWLHESAENLDDFIGGVRFAERYHNIKGKQ